jgi:hypothetical protein
MKSWLPSVSFFAVQLAFLLLTTEPTWAVTTSSQSDFGPGPASPPSSVFSTTTGNLTATPTVSGSNSASSSASSTTSADYPSLSGVSSCVTQCFETAIGDSNCTSVTDVNCFCVSGKFPPDIVSCISTTCPSELSSAEQLSQQFCNVASSHPTLTFPSPTVSSTSSTSSSATPTSISSSSASVRTTATQSASAAGRSRGEDAGPILLGLMVGVAGMLVGALYV